MELHDAVVNPSVRGLIIDNSGVVRICCSSKVEEGLVCKGKVPYEVGEKSVIHHFLCGGIISCHHVGGRHPPRIHCHRVVVRCRDGDDGDGVSIISGDVDRIIGTGDDIGGGGI